MDDDRDRNERTGRWAPGGSGRRFTACVDFEAGPFTYAQGMAYTADSEALDELVDEWLEDGRVKIGLSDEMATRPASATGVGTVKQGDN